MKNNYNMVCHFQIEAVCCTPLRIGNHENNTETVLKSIDGTPFIPGTSIAGAIKSYLNREIAEILLGSEDNNSKIIVSDGNFTQYSQKSRPRVRISAQTGACEIGAKFDIAHIEKGSKFEFSLTWFGDVNSSENSSELDAINDVLSAINSGEITFGGQKTNGFGQVDITAYKKTFNLTNENDRNDWLNSKLNGDKITLKTISTKDKVEFIVRGRADNILVKSGTVYYNDKAVTENILEGEIPVIPGSSVKGAIRSRANQICSTIFGDDSTINSYFGNNDNDTPIAGKVMFSDIYLPNCKKTQVTRIRVNKYTGGVINSALFTEEPLSSNMEFSIQTPNEPEISGIILLVLRDLIFSLVNFGSGYAIGRGFIDVDEIEIRVNGFENAKIKVLKEDNSLQKTIDINDKDNLLELISYK